MASTSNKHTSSKTRTPSQREDNEPKKQKITIVEDPEHQSKNDRVSRGHKHIKKENFPEDKKKSESKLKNLLRKR